jgi:tRNA-2-methylthio-N6-dimethylallyladenosine synthase
MPSVFIKTYGCQMNERDSEAVAARLVRQGYTLAPSAETADVVLLNTCSVRDAAEQKAIGKMQALAGHFRRRRPEVVLGFLGCMAQSRGQELLDRLPDVDLVLGTQKMHRTGDYLDDLLAGRRERVVDVATEAGSEAAVRDHLPPGTAAPRSVSAFVSIMQGCNQYCTFCIVPYTRGLERSRTIEDIVTECRELAAQGVREVVLLGQIVTSYGRGLIPVRDGKSPFVQLLEAVHRVEGIARIRFTAPHPKGYGDDLVEAYGRLERLCPSAHLPVQSGSDRILKLMHRGYTRARFVEIVGKLRAVRPEIGITTDAIAGFPGETEEDFAATLDLIREVEVDQAYCFKYSPRKDTPAAAMAGQLPAETIEERLQRLLETVNASATGRHQRWVGRTVEVLVEGPSRRNTARSEGRTPTNHLVVFEGSPRHTGQLLPMRIERAGPFTLYGDPAILDPDAETAHALCPS